MLDIVQKANTVTAAAKTSGALIPIDTDYEIITDGNIDFLVRIARNLDRRQQAAAVPTDNTEPATAPANPFLPYEQALWVANIGANHAVLLNKFNVIDNHLLIVTKHYEHQDQLLTSEDLTALAALVANHSGLGFYNGGTLAGASQHHKHLQWIPGVDMGERLCVPIASHLPHISAGKWQFISEPFPMALATFDAHGDIASQLVALYREMTRQLGIDSGKTHASKPYNLLMTSSHLWIVLRAAECFESISLNAMAFAGSLFVKNLQQLELLKKNGPLKALRSTAASEKASRGN